MRKSGIASYCFPVLIAVGLSHPQTAVNLSGSVLDSRTQAPVAGASVRLARLGLNSQTNAGGVFSLASTSVLRKPKVGGGSGSSADPGTLIYRHDADGPVSIRILDFSGTERAVDGSASGSTPGVRIQTGPAERGAAKSSSSAPSAAPQADVDTLLVTKNGYRPARLPLSDYQRTGLTVLLEDTSATRSDDVTLVPDPSWTCYMPGGIPPPALGEAAFSISLQIGAIRDVGLTKFGKRRQYDIKGGAVTGTKINGTVLTGGLDYDLTLSNGSVEVEQIVIFRADNIPILMRNAGVAAAGSPQARVVLDFEAPNASAFSWLNTGKFAATRIVDTVAKTIRLDVYEISKVAATAVKVQITDPAGVPNQTWECFTLTGSQGSTVFTENVTLGTSISIGASKRGSRNIIPITGGTTTGRVAGKILNGGADYQLGGLDARYTLAPDNGEFIIVRNCGTGGLVPVFEARVDGAYAFLNENKYLSSQPNVSGSSVSLTFYEKK